MSLMTEVLTGANEAEWRGKNGPVGRGLAGEPGDVSSAPGSATASAASPRHTAGPCRAWGCSAPPVGLGHDPTVNEGERPLGICPRVSFIPVFLLQAFPGPLSPPSPSLCFAPSRRGISVKVQMQSAACKGELYEQGL